MIIISISQVGKQRVRAVMQIAQGHRAEEVDKPGLKDKFPGCQSLHALPWCIGFPSTCTLWWGLSLVLGPLDLGMPGPGQMPDSAWHEWGHAGNFGGPSTWADPPAWRGWAERGQVGLWGHRARYWGAV